MSDLMRISTNVQAMQARIALMRVNDKISVHQLRLATGRKINSAGEDPAGYALARSIESRRRGLTVALDNVGNAKNVLNIAEGGYQNIMDILQTCKEKATQAADGSLSGTQRESLDSQVIALIKEIDAIAIGTTFNKIHLINDDDMSIVFHTGEGTDDNDTLVVELDSADSSALSIHQINLSNAAIIESDATPTSLDVTTGDNDQFKITIGDEEADITLDEANYADLGAIVDEINDKIGGSALEDKVEAYEDEDDGILKFRTIGDGIGEKLTLNDGTNNVLDLLGFDNDDTSTNSSKEAISGFSSAVVDLSKSIQKVGEYKSRLSLKESTLSVAITNTEASRSVIEDADFAKEQMEVMKLMILQQTAVASLVQANSSPQIVLSLFQ